MSLLKKASIITTPTAYAEDYLYSIKPAETLGAELVTNGNFATDSDWTKGSGWTISGGTAKSDGTATFIFQDNVFTGKDTEIWEIRFKARMISGTNGIIRVYVGTNNYTSFTIADTGFQEFSFRDTKVPTSGSSNEILYFYNENGGQLEIDNVSVKKINQADFDFDRNSTGTRVNEDYLIEEVPYNLLRESEDATTTWGKTRSSITANSILAPNDTLTGDKFIGATTSGDKKLSQSITVNSGEQYTLSVFAKKGEFNGILLRHNTTRFPSGHVIFNLDTGVGVQTDTVDSFSSENVGNGWYRLSVTSTADSTGGNTEELIIANNGSTAITGNDSDGIYIWGMQSVKGDQPKDYLQTTDRLDIPRIDYTNGEPSILLEPSRQNEFTYSQDFTQGVWNKNNVTVTANQAISPEGIQNADKLVINNGTFNVNGGLYFNRTGVVNQDVSFSIFAKAGEFRYGTISYGSNSANGFHFDLEDGVILSTFTNTVNYTNIGYEMIAYPNGWYRLVVNTTEKVAQNRFIGIRPHNTIPTSTNNNYSSTGDGSSGIFVWGAQVEVGSYATSLIHTSGSAVTRSADVANNAGNSDLISSTEGVIYGEINIPENIDDNINIAISDGTNTEFVKFIYLPASSLLKGEIKGSGNTIAKNDTSFVLGSYSKVAVSYKSGEFKLYVNGSQIGNTLIGHTLPTGLNTVSFDRGDGNANFYGNSKMVAVFKEALTDTELACLTGYNNHELYMNYYNRLSYLGLVEEYNVESDINNYIL